MNLKRNFQLVVALMLLLPFSACTEESLYEDAILKVSENPVFFNKDASEKSIQIQSNRDKWEATSAQEGEWITLTKEGTSLKISVSQNPSGADRMAIVTVHAGDVSERIEVHQRASDILLESESSDVRLSTTGGTKTLRLFSNVPSLVKVEVEGADWLKASYKEGNNTFDLIAQANPELLPRSAKVILSAGQQARELNISQDGVYDLAVPLMAYPATLRDVIKFETGRDNILAQTPDGFQNKSLYRFANGNNIISNIEYEYTNLGLFIFDRASVTVTNEELFKSAEFETFMNLRGFNKLKGTVRVQNYINETLNFRARVVVSTKGGASLTFTYAPRQTEAFTSFSKLTPLDQVTLIGNVDEKEKGARKQEVLDFEASLGSTFNINESKKSHLDNPEILAFDAAASDAPESLRMYKFIVAGGSVKKNDPTIGELELTLTTVLDPTKVFWQFEDKYILTKELIAFMESKGYTYHSRTDRGIDRFYNPTQTMIIGFKPEVLEDYNDGKPFVMVYAEKQNFNDQSASVNGLEILKSVLKRK